MVFDDWEGVRDENPCLIVRSFLEDRLRVVVLLCSDVRGVSVTLKKNFRI